MCRMAGKTGSPMSLGSVRASFDRLRMPGSRRIKNLSRTFRSFEQVPVSEGMPEGLP
jgi:hypothetical protein